MKFTTPALAKVVKQFSTLDDTVAERAILERVEYSAVQEALAEKQVTSADANKWDALLDGRQPLTTVTKAVYKIADDLDDGTITATKAVALLKSLAASQKTTAADLLTRSGNAYVTADAALDLATLADAALTRGAISTPESGSITLRIAGFPASTQARAASIALLRSAGFSTSCP